MCLTICKPRKKKRTRVFKLLKKENSKSKCFYPPYFNTRKPYKLGALYKSNRPSMELTPSEKIRCEIDRGIHVFTSIHGALKFYIERRFFLERNGCYLVECEVDPKNLIADGYGSQAVYTEILPKKILRILNHV